MYKPKHKASFRRQHEAVLTWLAETAIATAVGIIFFIMWLNT